MTTKLLPLLLILTFLLPACQSTPDISPSITPVFASSETTMTVTVRISTSEPSEFESAPTALPTTETPAPTPVERTSPVDGMQQVYVPVGIVHMGGLDIHADDRDELPAHAVSLDAFWIDKFEVTNGMYMLCAQSGACTPPGDWASDRRASYFNVEEFKDYPVVHVTWEQAQTYCAWADRRLPTEAEWERAARGDDFRNYPWGDEPPSEAYANFNRNSRDTSRVGSFAAGAGPFGALDMAGNVWEWVSDFYEVEYYKDSPDYNPTGPQTSSTYFRVIRGGSFQDEWFDLRVSKRGAALGPKPDARFSDPNGAGEHTSKVGFRCAKNDE